MPKRSSNTSVLRWPDLRTVVDACRRWAIGESEKRPRVRRIGIFGSYARGEWGVGSDVDLVVIVDSCEKPFLTRSVEWDLSELPVPADLLVYTTDEWTSMQRDGGRFASELESAEWLFVR